MAVHIISVNKFIITCCLVLAYLFVGHRSGHAEDDPAFTLAIGVKAAYAQGVTDPYVYYWPFCDIGYHTAYFNVDVGIARYYNYQVSEYIDTQIPLTDIDYEYIVINKLKLGASFTPSDFFMFGFSFDVSRGDLDYKKNNVTLQLGLFFTQFGVLFENSWSKTEYAIDAEVVNYQTRSAFAEFSYYISKQLSSDLSFSHMRILSDVLEETYARNSIRLGIAKKSDSAVFLIAGGKYATDSIGYRTYGFDVGGNLTLFNFITFSVVYEFARNIYQGNETTIIKRRLFVMQRPVPYESYNAHNIITGLTLKY